MGVFESTNGWLHVVRNGKNKAGRITRRIRSPRPQSFIGLLRVETDAVGRFKTLNLLGNGNGDMKINLLSCFCRGSFYPITYICMDNVSHICINNLLHHCLGRREPLSDYPFLYGPGTAVALYNQRSHSDSVVWRLMPENYLQVVLSVTMVDFCQQLRYLARWTSNFIHGVAAFAVA